jgi:ubiquinone/menaquinone biosynthesis C-methylase UbiE
MGNLIVPITSVSGVEAAARRRFFYAEAEAGMYDGTIDLVVPKYRALHKVLVSLVGRQIRSVAGATPAVVLDVGSGTGMESIGILRTIRSLRVVAVDLCRAMQEIHLGKMRRLERASTAGLTQRCNLVQGDVLSDLASPEALLRKFPGDVDGPFSAVVTSLTVHHFSHRQKQQFYNLAYKVLRPGGVFINADLFSYADPELTEKALQFDLEWMRTQFKEPSRKFVEARALPRARRLELLERWLIHYSRDNRLEPIEDSEQTGQAQMLKKAGFHDVTVAYRSSLSGILVGKRLGNGPSGQRTA